MGLWFTITEGLSHVRAPRRKIVWEGHISGQIDGLKSSDLWIRSLFVLFCVIVKWKSCSCSNFRDIFLSKNDELNVSGKRLSRLSKAFQLTPTYTTPSTRLFFSERFSCQMRQLTLWWWCDHDLPLFSREVNLKNAEVCTQTVKTLFAWPQETKISLSLPLSLSDGVFPALGKNVWLLRDFSTPTHFPSLEKFP